MPSPFPGMDPYLESHWQAIHTILISDSWRWLNRILPEGLAASVEERIAVETDQGGRRRNKIGPDVRILMPHPAAATPGPVLLEAPYELEPGEEPVFERYVGIVDSDGRVVTVIEFVSPSNKRRPGVARFRRNRTDLLSSGVHVVEIDLVRGGSWRALMKPEKCPDRAVTAFRAVVRTAGDEGTSYLYPMSLREPLPDVPVPLRPDDRPVLLPLQTMVTNVYNDGRYASRIDYRRPARPPLDSDDAQWAATLTAAAR